jgi:predicted transcriptional regulator
MTEQETYSWIFLATALASQTGSTNQQGISSVADGINHAVPTHKEMNSSLNWLREKKLIEKDGKKYQLSQQGNSMIDKLSGKDHSIMIIWNRIEKEIKNYA